MKMQNKKTKTSMITILAVTLGIVMLSPMTVLPSINAEANNPEQNLPPAAISAHNQIREQLQQHPGWMGIMKWDSNGNTTIVYLGPAESNPFKLKPGPMTSLSTSLPINVQKSPSGDRSSGGVPVTSEWKEVNDFTSQASTNSNVDYYHVFNALNSNKGHWLQEALVYDIAKIYNPNTAQWKDVLDSWNTSTCTEDAGFPTATTFTTSTGDSIEQAIYADTSVNGQYDMQTTDVTTSSGSLASISVSGDTGNTINLGSKPTCGMAAGPQVEEHDKSNTSQTYNFGSIAYTLGFYDTSTSTKTTSVVGWDATQGCGASPSTQNSPAKITWTFSGAC